jgi:parallel beta-helix repeat protein
MKLVRHGLTTVLAGALALGCSSDTEKKGGGVGDAGTDGSSTVVGEGGKCDVTLQAGADDQTTVQGALDSKVKSGNTVCFSPGTYRFTNHVSLGAAANVTFRGTGKASTDVVFDFTGQTAGSEGVLVTTDDFTIENLWIKNTQGNGIKVQADRSTFRGIKVSWDQSAGGDGGPLSGAYAIYPTLCDHTLLENNEVSGASDAGIYAGQCKHVIARNNHTHDNVLGIEIENTIGAEVYGNDVHDNSTGILLDLLQNLQQTTATDYLVHDNDIHDNNLPNFAEHHKGQTGTTALLSIAPQGTGILLLAPSNVEITGNKIRDNGGVGVIIISQDTADLIVLQSGGTPEPADPATSRWPSNLSIHDNTFAHNGSNPVGPYALVAPSDGGKQSIPYAILWDGVLKPGVTAADTHICLGATERASFLDFHAPQGIADPSVWSTDTSAHQCTLTPIQPLTP